MNRIFLFLFLIINSISYSQNQISGIVVDSASHEPLPFVNIAVKGSTQGTVSALNGKFSLNVNELPITIVFSYVGYAKKEMVYNESNYKKIILTNVGFNLNEAVVFAGPNPALLIMKKVLANRKVNNPETNCQFKYNSYNKLYFTVEADSVSLNEKIKNNTLNKDDIETLEYMKKQHIFLMESVSEKKYASANKVKETILASKISGFQSPAFSVLSTQLQSFQFYTDEISLSEIKYIGPVSKGGLQNYNFSLQDTFYLGNDSVYVISFYPKNEKDHRCMKGLLQINTDGYALYNVIAEPAVRQEKGFGIKISQQYKKINNQQWFPYELTSKILVYEAQIESFALIGLASGQIENIVLNPEFSKKEFDEIEIELAEDIELNSKEKLDRYRSDTLTTKEKETYRIVDSIGKANKFDKKILALKSLVQGYVPIKFINWDITKLFAYNDYEKFRLGLGLRTNHKISKWFSLGGYLAYGFGDKAFKFGYDLNLVLNEKHQTGINFSYTKDIEAASGTSFFEQKRLLMNQGYANLFVNRYDSVSKYEARVFSRAFKHFKFHLFGNYQVRESFENYTYRYPLGENVTLLDQTFTLAEYGLEFKMAINEKFIETPFGLVSKGTKWPMLTFRYTKGTSGFKNSEYDYQRLVVRAEKIFSALRWGTASFSLAGGYVQGEAPYHLLFNPTGTYKPIQKLTIYSLDGFETIRNNEFLLDQYASLHFRYRFAQPIFKGEKFRPYFSIVSSALIGQLKNSQNHENLTFTSINKPYTESGILIDNLIHSGISSIGLGAFYRWGNYSLPTFTENLAIKISIAISLE